MRSQDRHIFAAMKTCTICKTNKAVSEFYKHSMTADGCHPWCKECHKERCKQNRRSDLHSYRAKQRERSKTERQKEVRNSSYKKALASGKHTQSTKLWRERNPEKYKAHLEVKKALYRGVIKKTGCIVCGEAAQAHHGDYSKPLEIVWLCQAHHAEHHVRERNGI